MIKNKNCLDCRNIKFNLDNYNFNYFPSVETFSNIDTFHQDFKTIKLNLHKREIK